MKGTKGWKRAILAGLVVGLAVVLATTYVGGIPRSHPSSAPAAAVSWNPTGLQRFHAPLSAMGVLAASGALPEDQGFAARTALAPSPAVGGGNGSLPVNALRYITDQSYLAQTETSLALGSSGNATVLLGSVNDARVFFCAALFGAPLPAADCPSNWTYSLSGFTIGTAGATATTSTVVMSDDLPGLLYTSTRNPTFHGFLMSYGDPSVAFDPAIGQFLYSSLAIDPFTGDNGIELAVTTPTFWSDPGSCVTTQSTPWANPCWNATLVFGNLTGFIADGIAVHVPTSFEDKELIAVDQDPSSSHYGDVYVTWDHFFQNGRSSSYGARCTSALSCTMISGGPAPRLSGGDPYVAFTTPVVGTHGTVYVTWCNYGTPTSLGPISCRVVSSPSGGGSFGANATVLSFEGNGTTFPNDTGLVGYATEQFRTDSVPVLAVDASGGPTDGNLYFTIAVCTSPQTYYEIYAPAIPGTCGRSTVLFSSSTNGGANWSAPTGISPPSAWVNAQPWVTVDNSNGAVVVTYYTSAFDPFQHRLDVVASESFDGGHTFASPLRMTNISNEPNSDPTMFYYLGSFGGSWDVPQYGDYFQSIAVNGEIWTLFTGDYATELGTFQADPFLVSAGEHLPP